MTSVDERLAELEARLTAAEDRLAIANLIASYGPAVDRRDGSAARELWSADGEYVIGDDTVVGDAIADIVDLPGHISYVTAGCGHILSPAQIDLHGDRAIATNYSMVVMHEGARWVIDRLSANRWELERTADGWQVSVRANRTITGVAEARELLRANR